MMAASRLRRRWALAPVVAGEFAPVPEAFWRALDRWGGGWTRFLLVVRTRRQRMDWYEVERVGVRPRRPQCRHKRRWIISTARAGMGQIDGSHQTPSGLHRVARRIGGGYPVGAVFEARRHVGYTWKGRPRAAIAHRILWLEGLEPGWNSGGSVDSFRRYIYIHGLGDELTLGRPGSRGCVHLAAADLLPLFDAVPVGTLVWISES